MFFWVLYSIQGLAFAQESRVSGFRVPCHDGWAECFDNQDIQGSRFIYDDNQLRHDVRARVSFWDFAPLSKETSLIIFPEDEAKEKINPKPGIVRKKPKTINKIPEPVHDLEELSWACAPLQDLEDAALLGVLQKNDRECVEENLHQQVLMTQKVRLSKILITNAQKNKDYARWERLVLRHLTKFDRSDANMSFGFGLYLFNKKKYIESIKWCDTALEQSHTFSKGNDTKEKKYQLYQVRASAASKLWKKYAEELTKYQDDYNRERIEKKIRTYKAKTKNFSREWLDYARASSAPTTLPLKLCIAASNRDFCK